MNSKMVNIENSIFYVSASFLIACALSLCTGIQILIVYKIIQNIDGYGFSIFFGNIICIMSVVQTALAVQKMDDVRRSWNEFYVREGV